MLLVVACCFSGCVITPREQNTLFTIIPQELGEPEARKAIRLAAIQRDWQVVSNDKEMIQIELKQWNYHAVLHFTFSDEEIRYCDNSMYLSTVSTPRKTGFPKKKKKGEWQNTSVKGNWIANLKHDVNIIFNTMIVKGERPARSTSDPIADKLISLKKLFHQDLITEAEYQKKREEILSAY